MGIIAGILSLFGSTVQGLFGFKTAQADTVNAAIKVLSDQAASDASREQAISAVICAEANAGGIAAIWRPLLMLIFMSLIVSFWFGYSPPNMNGPMPPIISEIFDIIKIGIGGYIPARSIEKIINQLNLGSVLKQLIAKKVL